MTSTCALTSTYPMASTGAAIEPVSAGAAGPPIQGIARAVSEAGSPPVLSIACTLLCAHMLGTRMAWSWAALHSVLAILVPTGYVALLVHRGVVSDLHLRVRAQRIRPLMVYLAGHTLSLALHHAGGAPLLLTLLVALSLVQLTVFLGITLRWKISMHCTAAAGLAVLGVALLGPAGLPMALLLPVIAWSRLYLNRHTPAQTLAGTALGLVLWLAGLQVLGG